MSDFLSNFDKTNYKQTVTEKKGKKEQEKLEDDAVELEKKGTKKKRSSSKSRSRQTEQPLEKTITQSEAESDGPRAEEVEASTTPELEPTEATFFSENDVVPPLLSQEKVTEKVVYEKDEMEEGEDNSGEEETEIDPTYKKRKQRKLILFSLLGLVSAVLLFWLYYSMTHVAMPKFTGKPVSEARAWASENNVKLDVEQKYDFDKEVNTVVKQDMKAGKKVKKKSTVKLVASLGANPEDVIPLPDFSKLSKSAADEWVVEQKAENLSILEEYSDKVEKGKFIRQEINNKDVTPEKYKREDQAVVYFSKGKEVFEKDVAVPDFDKKTKVDVEAWVKTNEIKMEYKAIDSDKIEEGFIISQSIAKGTKIAKRDTMSVEVSTGKSISVPNFGELTPESAATVEGMAVTVKTTFSWDIPYGSLISQSIPAGEKVKEKEMRKVAVNYSAGKPYLRSYFGQLEGDLEKLFFDDYRSKGANIKFTTYYVDSAEERGKVVNMSAYNQYVPLDFTVNIAVSNGNQAGKPTDSPGGRSGDTGAGADTNEGGEGN